MRYSCLMDEEFRTGYGRDWLDFAITLVGRYDDRPVDLVLFLTELSRSPDWNPRGLR